MPDEQRHQADPLYGGVQILWSDLARIAARASRVVIEPPVDVPANLDRKRGIEEALRRLIARVEHYTPRHPSLDLTWHALGMIPAATATP